MKSATSFVADHVSADAAIAWVDAAVHCLGAADSAPEDAHGRVLANDILADRAIPGSDRSMLDGFAVEASATLGASAYNPIEVPLRAVDAGDVMPVGTDAVISIGLAQLNERGHVELVEPATPGDNLERQGAVAGPGAILARAGSRLSARHIGLLTMAGFAQVPVVCQPRVRVLLVKPARADAGTDSNGPLIRAAVERDGGVVDELIAVERSRPAIRDALTERATDLVLVIGGTGVGVNDHSASALAEAGELAIRGVTLRPGETTGLGRTVGGVPVVLLPGMPAACLWGYELFAGRAIRRLAGRDPQLPYRSREMTTARKVVSAIGLTEICPVRCRANDAVEPLPSFRETGLMGVVNADGFVIVPETSEGHPQGARVMVYLYEGG